jgi:hypothetical protein
MGSESALALVDAAALGEAMGNRGAEGSERKMMKAKMVALNRGRNRKTNGTEQVEHQGRGGKKQFVAIGGKWGENELVC